MSVLERSVEKITYRGLKKLTKNNYTAEEVAKLLRDAEEVLVSLKTHYGSNQNETLCNRLGHGSSLNWDEVTCRSCLKRREGQE